MVYTKQILFALECNGYNSLQHFDIDIFQFVNIKTTYTGFMLAKFLEHISMFLDIHCEIQ